MSPDHTDFRLLKAAIDLTSSLDLKNGLQNFVNQACALTSSARHDVRARYLGCDNPAARAPRLLPAPPVPDSLPSAIPVTTPLLVNSPQDAPDIDLPASTPPFLGVSVLVHEQVYGRLYLMGKPGGYTDEERGRGRGPGPRRRHRRRKREPLRGLQAHRTVDQRLASH